MKGAGVIGALVIGASLVLAAAVFALVGVLLQGPADTAMEARLARLEQELDGQSARLAGIDEEIRELRRERDSLREEIAAARQAAPVPVPAISDLPPDQFGGDAAVPATEGLVDDMGIAKGRFNEGIVRPTPALMRELLGEPRQSYSQDCQPVTNPRLIEVLDTRQIGTFRLTMIRPALDSFEAIMERLRTEEPEIYAALGTAGALCARYVRGSASSVSSHAWGAAVDLTLTGELDRMGDASTQFGLVVLAEHFNDAGWYWGAGYGREDSMHFEPGEALLRQWIAEGRM